MYRNKQKLFWALVLSLLFSTASSVSTFVAAETLKQQTQEDSVRVESVQKINPTTVQVKFSNNQLLLVDFYADNIFRLFQDNKSAVVRDPQAEPAAQILVNNPRKKLHNFEVSE